MLRLEVMDCSVSASGSRPTCIADMTVWRPSESQLQELQEGSRFRVFHLDIKSKFRTPSGGVSLSLRTQKCTRWENVMGLVPSHVPFKKRSIQDIASLRSMPVGVCFDAALYVLRIGPEKRPKANDCRVFFDVFTTDCSGMVLVVEMYRALHVKPFKKKSVVEGSVFCAQHLSYGGFDRKCGFHLSRRQTFSQLSTRPKQSLLQKECDRLRCWIKEEDGIIVKGALQQKLNITFCG